MTIFGRTISRLTLLVAGIILILALIAFGTSQCSKRKNEAAQARVERGQATAGATVGGEAVNTLEGVVANDAATDDAVATGIAATREAPEANRDAVAVNSLCQFKSARNKPECAR